MKAFRLSALWRASPIVKRTAAIVGLGFAGLQAQKAIYPERNSASSFFWNSSSKTAPTPPSSPKAALLQVEPYGPTSLQYADAEMRDLTKAAVLLYRECFIGNTASIQEVVNAILPLWSTFAFKEVRDLNNEAQVTEKIHEYGKKFEAELTPEGRQLLKKILPILGVNTTEQIFMEAAQRVRDPKTVTVGESMPHALRVIVRLIELRKYNEMLSKNDEFDYKELAKYPISQVPQQHKQSFIDNLKKAHPRLTDEVANVMGDLASYRIKISFVEQYIPEDTLPEVTRVDHLFKLFEATTRWTEEYTIAKKTSTPPFERFITDNTTKEFPKLSDQDKLIVLLMAKEAQR